MSENGILQAEQRVREMNRVARQYSEQGNRYLQQQSLQQNRRNQQGQNMRSAPASQRQQNMHTRFEPMRQDGQNDGTYNIREKNDPPEPPAAENPPERKSSRTDVFSILSDFKMDNEKLMIMLIMYILIKEKADIKLILSLGYLLL